MQKKVLVVIQARADSKRLPGKALLPLGGVPMIAYLIRRLRVLPASFTLVVATTEKRGDDRVAQAARDEGVEVIRGEEDDVLARYMRCMKTFSCDIVVRVTGDNPLTDPSAITRAVEKMISGGYDYVRAVDGFPVGTGADVFSSKTLTVLNESARSAPEREHIDAYVLKHMAEFKIAAIRPEKDGDGSGMRLTVDNREDYERVKLIVDSHPAGTFITIENAIR